MISKIKEQHSNNQQINNNNTNTNLMSVYMSCSRESSNKHLQLGLKLLGGCKKEYDLDCVDLTDDTYYNSFDLSCLPGSRHLILFTTPLSFLRFFRNK